MRVRFLAPLLFLVLLLPRAGFARDAGADGHFERRKSTHFILYQDVGIDQHSGLYGSDRFEREVLATLEGAFDQVTRELGLRPLRPISVVIYDPGVFDAEFGGLFRFVAAGFYEGVIRVRGAERLDAYLSQVLIHELVHATLDAEGAARRLPGWLNEGVAELYENRSVGARGPGEAERHYLRVAVESGAWIPMADLGMPSFAGLGPEEAGRAYLQSYALVTHIEKRYGEHRLRELLRDLLRGMDLQRALRRATRHSLEELETELQRGL